MIDLENRTKNLALKGINEFISELEKNSTIKKAPTVNTNEPILFIAHPDCGHCTDAKELLKDKISSGKYKVMDVVNDKEAQELAKKYKVDGYPTFIVGDSPEKMGEVCNLARDGKKLICENNKIRDL